MMKFQFENQVALVTGRSRGIGRVIAQMFAEAGARVVVHYRSNRVAAEETLGVLAGEGHMIVAADIGVTADLERLTAEVMAQMGRIDILVNNAGVFFHHPLATTDFATWRESWDVVLRTNLIGVADLCYLVGQEMIKQGGGRIVNVSSRGAFRGEPDAPAYGASKAGLNGMGQSLAQSLAPHNVFVHTVAPGFVETDMAAGVLAGPAGEGIRQQSPLGRVARPEEVARAVLFCASAGTEFMTGCIIDVNGASYLRS